MEKEKPIVSYVLTAYNIEDFIEEAIRCAFAQTYTPLEIVLSDDCSTDRTFEIMEEMAKNYTGPHTIKLNRNNTNLGITRHMNKAYLEIATGDIIIAAHGDDISIPERTSLSVEFLKKHPDVTAVSLSMESIDAQGKSTFTDNACVANTRYYDFEKGGNIPAPSRAFYKNVMTTFGPLNDDCPTEDELITGRALMLGKNAFLPEVGVYYRKHALSSSNPENFDKFPLEMILKQKICDMEKGVALGLITEVQKNETIRLLEEGMAKRKLYRKYFANRNIKNLMILVGSSKYSLRSKLHLIKTHFINKWAER